MGKSTSRFTPDGLLSEEALKPYNRIKEKRYRLKNSYLI
jgi:hypothetical protein